MSGDSDASPGEVPGSGCGGGEAAMQRVEWEKRDEGCVYASSEFGGGEYIGGEWVGDADGETGGVRGVCGELWADAGDIQMRRSVEESGGSSGV